jgi:hypothetical protein
MKKTIKIVIMCMFFYAGANGQAFDKDTKVVALGVGLGSSLGGFNYSSQVPGLSIQYEQGMWQAGNEGVISLGGYAGFKSFSYKTTSGSFEAKSKWNYTIIGVRSAFHYQGLSNEKIDLFGGLMLSYNILNYSYSDNTGQSSTNSGNFGNSAGVTLYVGGRYFFSEKVSAFAELGYGVSYLNLGVAFKL